MATQNCPLCHLPTEVTGVSERPLARVKCVRCGSFEVDDILLEPGNLLGKKEDLRIHLSFYTRRCTEERRSPSVLDESNLQGLSNTYRRTPVQQKLDYLLRLLAKRTQYAGSVFEFNPSNDAPAIAAVNPTEFMFCLNALRDMGYVTFNPPIVTVKGWERIGSDNPEKSGRCFVAMSFDPQLKPVYDLGIHGGISDARYEPIRVDEVEHNGKICDRIVAEIRQSQFLVSDVTGHSPGVYFEAGFAMGLGRPVIWSCRESDLGSAHFDTRQYNHIVWTTPDELRVMLRDRIIATIGRGPQ